MAFIVQDDTGEVADANAYIEVQFFKDYHTDRGNSYGAATDGQIQLAIIKATDYLDRRFSFVGWPLVDEQTTQWPREPVYTQRGTLMTTIPTALKQACAEYALRALTDDLMPDPTIDTSGGEVTRLTTKVGPIEKTTEYAAGSSSGGSSLKAYPNADRLLRGLTMASGGVER